MAVGLNEGGAQDDQKLTIAGDFGSIRLSNDMEDDGDEAQWTLVDWLTMKQHH